MICHKNLYSLLHNPTLAMLGLLQILYIIPTNFWDSRLWSGSNVWTFTSSIWQPIKHLIPTRPFLIWFLPASVKLWCWSITYVWHHNHDTICQLSGSSSSMPFYHPPMPSQSPQITVHHAQNPQSHQDEDDDGDDDDQPQQQQPPRRPNRPRRRPTCGTGRHR